MYMLAELTHPVEVVVDVDLMSTGKSQNYIGGLQSYPHSIKTPALIMYPILQISTYTAQKKRRWVALHPYLYLREITTVLQKRKR